MTGLIGRKLGMTRVFGEDGAHVPCTVIEAGPCPVVQVVGDRVQLGFGKKKATRTPKALVGHAKKAGLDAAPRIRGSCHWTGKRPKPGEAVTSALPTAGDRVQAAALTNGRGFQAVLPPH